MMVWSLASTRSHFISYVLKTHPFSIMMGLAKFVLHSARAIQLNPNTPLTAASRALEVNKERKV